MKLMPKAEISWKRQTPEGETSGNVTPSTSASSGFSTSAKNASTNWQAVGHPPLEDWLALLDSVPPPDQPPPVAARRGRRACVKIIAGTISRHRQRRQLTATLKHRNETPVPSSWSRPAPPAKARNLPTASLSLSNRYTDAVIAAGGLPQIFPATTRAR